MTDFKKINPIKLPNTQLTLIGESIAAKQTSFYIPELKVMLDCGVPNEFIPDHIFITHGHADHSKNLPLNLVQLSNFKFKEGKAKKKDKDKKKETRKINIYVPKEIEMYVRDYIHSFYVLSKYNPNHKAHNKYNLIGVAPNEKLNVNIRNKNWTVEIIKCYHTVPCVGYGFIDVRRKLKEEYVGLSKEEIIKLRKDGTEIDKEVEVPIFCYLGDTNEWIFDSKEFDSNIILKYPIIMIECTFIHPDQKENAKNKKHIHIDNLDSVLKNNLNKHFILYHFSDRYERNEVIEFFSMKNYGNVTIWI